MGANLCCAIPNVGVKWYQQLPWLRSHKRFVIVVFPDNTHLHLLKRYRCVAVKALQSLNICRLFQISDVK